jgi:predicted DsbA family dithiol-disulfide isomerase
VRIDELRREFDLEVRYSPFPLHPETPPEGLGLAELFAGRMDVGAMMNRLHQVATQLNLPFGERTHTYNSRKAQELGKWAEAIGVVEAFHQAVYRAYFVEGENIADDHVLSAIIKSLGLDVDTSQQVLADRRYATAIDDDWHRAAELGVTAVPTLISGGRHLVGFQPYDQCRAFIVDTA